MATRKRSRPRSADVSKQLGRRIRILRKDQGLSQEELAFRSQVHVTYLSGLERGARNPTITVLASVANGLRVSVATLMEGM